MAAGFLAVALAACSGGGDTAGSSGPSPSRTPSATSSGRSQAPFTPLPRAQLSGLPPCHLPQRVPLPEWLPTDLPFPAGMYASQDVGKQNGYFRGLFVLPGTTTVFARFVLKAWPEAGYQLGRGDSEPGEVEDVFAKPPSVGAFKAQDQNCNPGFTLMLLIYTPNRTTLPLPGTSPQSPLPTAS